MANNTQYDALNAQFETAMAEYESLAKQIDDLYWQIDALENYTNSGRIGDKKMPEDERQSQMRQLTEQMNALIARKKALMPGIDELDKARRAAYWAAKGQAEE